MSGIVAMDALRATVKPRTAVGSSKTSFHRPVPSLLRPASASRHQGRSFSLNTTMTANPTDKPYKSLGQTPMDVGSQGGMPIASPTKIPDKVKVKDEVTSTDLGNNVTLIRSWCDEDGRFEPEYKRNVGSTENAYLIKADKTCLLDLPEGPWAKAFTLELRRNHPGPLDYIVLSHFSPRICATLIQILRSQPAAASPVEVYCSNPTQQSITALLKRGSPVFNRELYEAWTGKGDGWGLRARLVRVRTGDKLPLGEGHNLSFLLANLSRWPEGIFTYDPVSQKLFTAKFFGAHTRKSDKQGLDAGTIDDYKQDWAYYFDTLIGPIAQQAEKVVQRANIEPLKFEVPQSKSKELLSKVLSFFNPEKGTVKPAVSEEEINLEGKLGVATLCPRHGPVVRNNLSPFLDFYNEMLTERIQKSKDVSVAVIYASAYGNTGIMANALVTGLERSGVNVKLLDCEFSTASEVLELVKGCQGFALGSPTLGGHTPTPVSEALGAILKGIERDVPYGVFGSYGWSGEAVPSMQNSLEDGGFKSAFAPISLKFKPTPEMIEVCEQSGEQLAETVKKSLALRAREEKKVLAQNMKAMTEDEVSRSVGRITTSAAILTANINNTDLCSWASWISQASFNPPAVTVAMKKETTPQDLMLLNAKFTINILGDKNTSLVRKLANQGFKEGDECFKGIEVERNEETGCAVLKDAASYLTCTVTNRLDVGDHWVLLAEIGEGKVLDMGSKTYFHHRQVGTTY